MKVKIKPLKDHSEDVKASYGKWLEVVQESTYQVKLIDGNIVNLRKSEIAEFKTEDDMQDEINHHMH